MKKVLLTLAGIATAVSVLAQSGQIGFNNRVTGQVIAPVYGPQAGATGTIIQGNTPSGFPPGTTAYNQLFGLGGTTGPGAAANFICQLFGAALGTPDDALQPLVPTTTFRTTATSSSSFGLVQATATAVDVPGVPIGTAARIQLRVWERAAGDTWATAFAAAQGGQYLIGRSLSFDSLPLGGGTTAPPGLNGLTSFNLYYVPEPSVIALGVLGLGALVLLRRRQN